MMTASKFNISDFTIFPAIDLKQGQCVRLYQGDMNAATTYNHDPADQAMRFVAEGARYLHIVDLDGAFAGQSANGAAVEAILATAKIPVQLGGGIRNLTHIEAWLNKGVTRVILGTAAVRDPDFVKAAIKAFPGQVMLGLDAKAGQVAIEGWATSTDLSVLDVAKNFQDDGVAGIIFTDIGRDGAGKGVNLDETLKIAQGQSLPVIASGGVADLNDISKIIATKALAGVIVGRALYEGAFALGQAMALLEGTNQ